MPIDGGTTTVPGQPFAACAAQTRRLYAALLELERAGALLQLEPLAGREWFELLRRKLLPQLDGDPFIVAAVVGGTNIGKSVIFNHLAGCQASAVSPLASGTKNPVCLVPPGFEERHRLADIFAGFELVPWSESQDPLEASNEHRLFWKTADELPPNLLVLDTPDIDSDAEVNWLRADCIRHCADVLIAILTQQKYNDAAVKQFFRKAAEEDKAVIVVFNQCLLPEDEQFWPKWLETFSTGTGILPELVYLAPNDRRAAESNRLGFFPRQWPANGGGPANTPRHDSSSSRRLAPDLAELHFVDVKLRTLRGSLVRLLSSESGAPAYLEEIRRRSASFEDAARLLSMQHLARVDNWPSAPPALLVDEIRRWWRAQRRGFTKAIHDAYGAVGEGVFWPFRWARQKLTGGTIDARETYRSAERDVMLQALETLYAELGRLSQLGNDLLRPRLEGLLAGSSRTMLLERLRTEHAAVDLDEELRSVVGAQMLAFRDDNPSAFGVLRKLDSMAAVARPMTSVVLFVAAGPVGHAFTPAVTGAAAHSMAAHILGDIAGGTGAVVMGETALSGTAGGLRLLEARFRQLQAAFMARRVAWFSEFLRRNILGNLHVELQNAAAMPQLTAFCDVASVLDELETQLSAVWRK
ncbi:MAG TPA: GTPase [Planctomycetaceae bacterium]|nr:GTPase [Planctomycetaceae bacterium]